MSESFDEIKKACHTTTISTAEYYTLDETNVTLSNLLALKQHISSNKKAVKVQYHFNVDDLEQYYTLISNHSITMQDYEEIFYDTTDNDLMKRSIWSKQVVAGKNSWFIIKYSLKTENVLRNIEVRVNTMDEMKEVILKIVKIIDSDSTADIGHKLYQESLLNYKFPVFRYILSPKDKDLNYKITIDNMLCSDDQVYTVCAVQTECALEEVDQVSRLITEPVKFSITTTKFPALSKIGYLLRKDHADLFTKLSDIFGEHSYNSKFEIFDMDLVYAYKRPKPKNTKYNAERAAQGYNSSK
jgi:hypothetical protein